MSSYYISDMGGAVTISKMALVDTHAHLDPTSPVRLRSELQGAGSTDLQGILERAKEVGVNKIICVGTSIEASRKCIEIAEKYSNNLLRHSRESGNPDSRFPIRSGMTESQNLQIYASVGIHAQDGKRDVEKYGSLDKCIEELRKILLLRQAQDQNDKVEVQDDKIVVGVGECGYDIRTTDNGQLTTDIEKKFQGDLFEAQIELASELKLPLIIHCRNGWDETFDLLSTVNREPLTGVFHSWTGDLDAAKKALDLGFYISFSGIVTFGNAPKIQDVAKKMPLDRMLLETDSPFLTPEPMRGSKNEPKNVRIVGKFIADLRHQSFELISDTTSANATKLFGL